MRGNGARPGATTATISSSARRTRVSPTQRCAAALDADHPGLRHRGEPLRRLGRLEVVVVLGHQRHERLAAVGPGLQVLGVG